MYLYDCSSFSMKASYNDSKRETNNPSVRLRFISVTQILTSPLNRVIITIILPRWDSESGTSSV